jgi:hypothetical protein
MFYNQIIQRSEISGYSATLSTITMDLRLLELSNFDLQIPLYVYINVWYKF